MDRLTVELEELAVEKSIDLSESVVDDVLIYALFPQVGLKFLENRNNPDAFEPPPWKEEAVPAVAPAAAAPAPAAGPESYRVEVNGHPYDVTVSPIGAVESVTPVAAASGPPVAVPSAPKTGGAPVPAPLAGNIFKVNVSAGQQVQAGDVIIILEAMKMETEVRAPSAGTVTAVQVKEGDSVQVGDSLLTLA
jgi:oxaloacetate decarboxylase alpha subunit